MEKTFNTSYGRGPENIGAEKVEPTRNMTETMLAGAGQNKWIEKGRLSQADAQKGETEKAGMEGRQVEKVLEVKTAMTVEEKKASLRMGRAEAEDETADKTLVCNVEILGDDTITMMELLNAVKATCGRIVGCRCKGRDKYELTMGNLRGKERLLDGFKIKNSKIMASEVARNQRIVSFLNLPVYITDNEILDKLKLWGVEATSQIKRRKWSGTDIFDGTRFVRVRFTEAVSSLPYSTKFDTLEGTEFFRVIHDNQVKVCRLCIQPGHILRDCPDFVCFKCNKVGHYARECQEEMGHCNDCHERKGQCTCGTQEENGAIWSVEEEEEEEEEETRGEDMVEDMDSGDLSWSNMPDHNRDAEQSPAEDCSERLMDNARRSLGRSGDLNVSLDQWPAGRAERQRGGEAKSPEGGDGENSNQPQEQRSARGRGRDLEQGWENRARSRSSCRGGGASTQGSLPCGQRELAKGEVATPCDSAGTEEKAGEVVSNESTDEDFNRVVRGKFVRSRGNRSKKSSQKTLR